MNFLETKQFKKDKKKLPKSLQEKVVERLTLLLQDPFHPLLDNHKLHHPWDGCKSINVTGSIRIIYQLQGEIYLLHRVSSHPELY